MKSYEFTIAIHDFSADLSISGNSSLYELAMLINDAVGFDFDHPFEFCDNLDDPYRSKERYSLFADMGEGEGEPGVEDTPVEQVFKPGKKMVFYFDYGDEWMFLVECTDVKDTKAKRPFKKTLATRGTPPEQYPECDE